MVSEISAGSTPARSTTAFSTMAPSSCAGMFAKDPRKLPTGVRAAETITALVMTGSFADGRDNRLQPNCFLFRYSRSSELRAAATARRIVRWFGVLPTGQRCLADRAGAGFGLRPGRRGVLAGRNADESRARLLCGPFD